LGPPKKKGADFVSEMFKRARESGAEAVEGSASGAGGHASSSSSVFSGTAFRLGSDETPSEAMPDPSVAAGSSRPRQPQEFTLKMWQNGFSIDDGELRLYTDQANRAFLASVMAGRIPDELVKAARGGEVHVNMEDHKSEEFVKPKVSAKPFQGAGHMLGSVAPAVVSGDGAAAAPAASKDENAINEKKAMEAAKVSSDAPTTTIQIRLDDGSRLLATLNHSHTVGHLRQYITTARPNLVEYTLRASYPPKELTDNEATLESAQLLNAALLLRRK
jgi:UBX domain-containing protein 1